MLKKIILRSFAAFAVVVLIFVIVVAMQPSDFRVTRSAKMAAPPARVFEAINVFQNWNDWSPWAKLDPDAKYRFEGPASGVGAKFYWAGNEKVGEGHQEILESRPDELVRIKLHFDKPMEDTCTTEFQLKPVDDQTEVTWSMYGRQNFIGKAFCMFMNMDKMIGGDFEKGLANLKTVVESAETQAESASRTTPTETTDSEPAGKS